MWIHESFANYAENLFVEYHFTEKEAQDYVIGCRKLIGNDTPIIGVYGVNKSGSGDMYYKGGNMLHTLVTSGSKGSLMNLAQIMGGVGQQRSWGVGGLARANALE